MLHENGAEVMDLVYVVCVLAAISTRILGRPQASHSKTRSWTKGTKSDFNILFSIIMDYDEIENSGTSDVSRPQQRDHQFAASPYQQLVQFPVVKTAAIASARVYYYLKQLHEWYVGPVYAPPKYPSRRCKFAPRKRLKPLPYKSRRHFYLQWWWQRWVDESDLRIKVYMTRRQHPYPPASLRELEEKTASRFMHEANWKGAESGETGDDDDDEEEGKEKGGKGTSSDAKVTRHREAEEDYDYGAYGGDYDYLGDYDYSDEQDKRTDKQNKSSVRQKKSSVRQKKSSDRHDKS